MGKKIFHINIEGMCHGIVAACEKVRIFLTVRASSEELVSSKRGKREYSWAALTQQWFTGSSWNIPVRQAVNKKWHLKLGINLFM